jgi:hypothetical protein
VLVLLRVPVSYYRFVLLRVSIFLARVVLLMLGSLNDYRVDAVIVAITFPDNQ